MIARGDFGTLTVNVSSDGMAKVEYNSKTVFVGHVYEMVGVLLSHKRFMDYIDSHEEEHDNQQA